MNWTCEGPIGSRKFQRLLSKCRADKGKLWWTVDGQPRGPAMKVAIAAAVLTLLAQAKKDNPDLKYDEQAGVSIGKMPKNDEWAFKDKGYFEKSKLCVYHKVDYLAVDIIQVPPAPGQTTWDLKKQ